MRPAQNSVIRRSSSADNLANQNRQSTGRASSIGRPSSIGIFKTADGKHLESKDLAPALYDELEQLGYPFTEQFTVKTLLLPSTATFYSIFEFLIKTIGIQDVWNPNYLVQPNQPKNSNQGISSSQPQPNPVQQNKNRIDLVIHHLNFLKYPNVPKANILQNMTTPKHWTLMLQILSFLCYDCKFLNIYDAERVVTSMSANQDFICHYLTKVYTNVVTRGYEYLTTEEYFKNKKESLNKFDEILKGNMNYDKLVNNLNNLKKKYEHLNSQRNEFDNLLKEEDILIRQTEEEEAAFNNELQEYEDRVKRNGVLKNECASLKEKVNLMEREVAVKDAQYDRQLASGKQLGNLPVKHAQTLKELENLQNLIADADNEKDELYIKLNQKSIDVKACINKSNEILNRIKITTMIPLEEIPQLEIVDLHKRNILKEYKELFTKVRKEFNENIYKLPNQLSQSLGVKKMIESKIDSHKIFIKNLEEELKNLEDLSNELRNSTEIALLDANHGINMKKNDLQEVMQQYDLLKEKFLNSKEELNKTLEEKIKVENEIARSQSDAVEKLEEFKKSRFESHEATQKFVKSNLAKNQTSMDEFINKLSSYLESKENRIEF